jgi:hypothetical protein
MRWGQLTLVENDPPKLDVGYWLDYFKRCRCASRLEPMQALSEE